MKVLVIDTENSIQTDGPFGPSAKDPRNDIYTWIWGAVPDRVEIAHKEGGWRRKMPSGLIDKIKDADLIVGHNLGHDLEYFWRSDEMRDFLLRGGKLWCTQGAEYELTGHQHKYSALDELEEKYLGLKYKISRISRLFKSKIGADRIVKARYRCPRLFKLYEKYCYNDGKNTLLVFKMQYLRAKRENMLKIIELHNDYLQVCTQMATEGIVIDIDHAKKLQNEYNLKYIEHMEAAQNVLRSVWNDERLPPFNINSPDHKSAALFGGVIKCKVRRQIGVYKNGNPHFKTMTEAVWVAGLGISVEYTTATKKDGVYSVSDDVVQKISTCSSDGRVKKYVYHQKEAALYTKAANTDIQGLLTYNVGGKLYPNFNLTATATGRLSSSEPNMQNKSVRTKLGKAIHTIMVAPPGYYYVSADFSQLEKWLQAWVSGDPVLRERLLNGVCLHCVALAVVEGISYEEAYQKAKVQKIPEWDAKRTEAKITSFQMDYGAMAKSISESTGIPVENVEKIIAADKAQYPVKHNFFDKVVPTQIINTAQLSKSCDVPKSLKKGNNFTKDFELLPIYSSRSDKSEYTIHEDYKEYRRVGYYIDPLGGKYAFYDNGYKNKKDGSIKRQFSRTQPKNYPNQGGGAKVQAATSYALMPMLLQKQDIVKMILEIHDSKAFYVRKDSLKPVIDYIRKIITDVPKLYKERFNVDMPFKIPVEFKYGENAGELQEYKE